MTGLGYGDEGKGTTTDFLCRLTGAHTVVRTGGPQAFHTVITDSGLEHTFAQFGAGTLAGAKTHLSREMVIDPYAIMNEGRALVDAGVCDAFRRMTIDAEAVTIVPFQKAASRLRELARGRNPHGTVGIGVGEAVTDGETLGEDAIRAKDLGKPWLYDKIAAIRERKLSELAEIITDASLPEKAQREIQVLKSEEIVQWATEEFNYLARVVDVVDGSYLAEEILAEDGTVVFEPSQGMLLDRWHGFHPYTTMARPDPGAANSLLSEAGYDGKVTRLGLMRAYQTRHGYGPFVTEDAELSSILPDVHNNMHEWQGRFRVGHLDAVALRYAIDGCGGVGGIDGLSVSCLDRLDRFPTWHYCNSYRYTGEEDASDRLTSWGGEVHVIKGRVNSRDDEQLLAQERLGDILRNCQPVYEYISRSERSAGYREYLALIEELLGIPVAIASSGPKASDKRILSDVLE